MELIGKEYIYMTEKGHAVPVWIIEDCGMVQGKQAPWHKVKARPIGFQNCPVMSLDFAGLQPR